MEEDLKINLEEYTKQIGELYTQALALAVEVGYPSKESLPLLIARAAQQSFAVAVSAGYPADEAVAARLVGEAYLKASVLMEELRKRGYS